MFINNRLRGFTRLDDSRMMHKSAVDHGTARMSGRARGGSGKRAGVAAEARRRGRLDGGRTGDRLR